MAVGFSRPTWLCQALPGSAGGAGPDTAAVPAGTVVIGTGKADVEGRVLPLAPSAPGRVVEVLLRERVQPGAPLVRLVSEAAEGQLAWAEANVRVGELLVTTAEQRRQEKRPSWTRCRLAIRVAQLRVESYKVQVDRFEDLHAFNQIDKPQVETARKQLELLQVAVEGELMRQQYPRTVDADLPVHIA